MKTEGLGKSCGRAMATAVLVTVLGVVCVQAQPRQSAIQAVAANRSDVGALVLIAAARAGDLASVRELVLSGVNVNAAVENEGTALIAAARAHNLAMVNELLLLGADVSLAVRGDGNPLMAAAAEGDNAKVIERLIAAGANVSAVVLGDETALINASRSGSLDNVRTLVNHGADVNLTVTTELGVRRSPLNQAKARSVRDYLIAQGARP